MTDVNEWLKASNKRGDQIWDFEFSVRAVNALAIKDIRTFSQLRESLGKVKFKGAGKVTEKEFARAIEYWERGFLSSR